MKVKTHITAGALLPTKPVIRFSGYTTVDNEG